MKTRILAAGIIVALAMFAAESGAELFQKAVTAERAAGNLEEAIKLLQARGHGVCFGPRAGG